MSCTCEHRGYCPVLQIHTTSHIHRLCQKDQAQARRIADAMRANSPEIRKQTVEARRRRVELAGAQEKRLISWLQLFRAEPDSGVGDTAQRLLAQKKKQKLRVATDVRDAIGCLLRQCSCRRTDAVKRLNEQYPY